MRYLLQKIWNLLSIRERFYTATFIIALVFNGIFELVGIGLVMPIVALLSKPELIQQNNYLRVIYEFTNPRSQQQFILILCVGVIGIYIFKNLFMLKLTKTISRLINYKSATIASRLFYNYIHAPYVFHLKNNSSTLHKKLDMVEKVFVGVLHSLLIVITDVIVITFILALLFYCSPITTSILFALLVIVNLSLYLPFKNYNYNLGQNYLKYCRDITKYDLQALRGIKEIIVSDCQKNLYSVYSSLQSQRGKINIKKYIVGQIPRYFIETFVVTIGLGVLVVFTKSGVAHGTILLTLTLLAVSLVRMMPSMSRIQYNLTMIRHHLHSFNNIYEDFKENSPAIVKRSNKKALIFRNKIEIKNLTFAYESTQENIFSDFSLNIPYKSSLALVGATGCGKTTLVDIILGLLKPLKGQVCVDGCDIEENLTSWRGKIGYVPQSIFLIDSSILENVAWGTNKENIDYKLARECLNKAQLLDFVEALPGKMETNIGENGIRLSGGQRQRIGIARALYRKPEVLILDEATSALDNDTENAFVNALNSLKGQLTVIMIAHRLTTIRNCDIKVKL